MNHVSVPVIRGPFIRDAVKQFNDIGTLRRIDALNEMTALYKKYQQELSWLRASMTPPDCVRLLTDGWRRNVWSRL